MPSPKTLPPADDIGPDFVTMFMTDLWNFYLADPAVTVSWLLWIFQHATLARRVKNNFPRLYRMYRAMRVQSAAESVVCSGACCSHVLLHEEEEKSQMP